MITNIPHSTTRRDIMRAIIKKYHGTNRYKGITEHIANKILTRIFELKIAKLYNTGSVKIGHGLGEVVITSWETNTDDIKNFVVDWKRTKQLWNENSKAKQNKTLVRDLSATRQTYFHWVNKGTVPNLCYYSFKPSRILRIKLYKDTIKNKPIMFLDNE